MKRVFADTLYWIAIVNRRDQWHDRVMRIIDIWGQMAIVTTEEVLSEFLNYYSAYGSGMRGIAWRTAEKALSNPFMAVRPQSHDSFMTGFALYKARPDKAYSLTDCISMQVMRREGINDILTADRHFAQEGFTLLL